MSAMSLPAIACRVPRYFAFQVAGPGARAGGPLVSDDPFETRAIEAARGGNANAYDYLVAKYGKRVLSIAAGLVRNRADAEDLAQEAFVKAFQSLSRFRASDPFGPWIYRIVTNLSLDLLRSRRRREMDQEIQDAPAPSSHQPESQLLSRELGRRVDQAIESLPEMQRVVARLSLIEEFSRAEVAAMTGLSEGTVRSHLSHARERLRDVLHE